ncbi:LIC12162 family transferase [Leptospira yasudae]
MDRPVLFLGEWCRRYDRKHIWSTLDYEVAAPYGVDPEVKKRDFEYLNDLNDAFLNQIAIAMNELHSVSKPKRYWNLVLGHWIQRYLRVFYNRYKTIEQVLDRYEISGTASMAINPFDLAVNDSNDFVQNTNKTLWNHVLHIETLKFFDFRNFIYSDEPLYAKNLQHSQPPRAFWKKAILFFVNRVLPCFARESDAFLLNTYLPFLYELILQVKLGQMPQVWKTPDLPKWNIDEKLRSMFRVPNLEERNFETFAWRMLTKAIPRCFVEGYSDILENSKKVNWPKNPRFIFTSNNFDTDEIFKVWAAEKVLEGRSYFVGQHGNNYGTLRGIQNAPEIVDTDRFITWGWSRDREKHIPAFVFTKCKESDSKYDPSGNLLLIEFPPAMRLGPEDSWFDFTKYFEQQIEFYKNLPPHIRNKTIVRLHNSSKYFEWFDEERWREIDSEVKLDSYQSKIRELISRSRLVVHSYDSTGVLETLNLNLPTICFWRNRFTHLVEEAVPFYEALETVGIFHTSPIQLAAFISENWNSIDEWWFSPRVQEVREMFCKQYARRVKDPISTLKKLLTTSKVDNEFESISD